MSRMTLQIRAYDISPSALNWGFSSDGRKIQTADFPMRSGIAWSFHCSGGARILPLKAVGDEGWKRGHLPSLWRSSAGFLLLRQRPLAGSRSPAFRCSHAGLHRRLADRKCLYTIAATVAMELWRCDCTTFSLTWGFSYFPRNAAGARRDLGQIKAERAAQSWVGFIYCIIIYLLLMLLF